MLEVSGKKLSAKIPNIPPCFYSSDEAESLIKEFMRENSITIFQKNFQTSELLMGRKGNWNKCLGRRGFTGDNL